jgi:hypothetical protein
MCLHILQSWVDTRPPAPSDILYIHDQLCTHKSALESGECCGAYGRYAAAAFVDLAVPALDTLEESWPTSG